MIYTHINTTGTTNGNNIGGGPTVLRKVIVNTPPSAGSSLLLIDSAQGRTSVVGEFLFSGTTNQTAYTFTLANQYIVPATFSMTSGTQTWTSTNGGVISGTSGDTGTINYSAGTGSFTIAAVSGFTSANTLTASYTTNRGTTIANIDTDAAPIGEIFYEFQINNGLSYVNVAVGAFEAYSLTIVHGV